MGSTHRGGFSRAASFGIFGTRGISLIVVILFCFQFSRLWLAVGPEERLCVHLMESLVHGNSGSTVHDHAQDELVLPRSHDHGFFFQHCKNTYEGMGLTPVQPFGVPVRVFYEP